MTTTQRLTTRPGATLADPTRRAATIFGWLFIVTYVTSMSATIGSMWTLDQVSERLGTVAHRFR